MRPIYQEPDSSDCLAASTASILHTPLSAFKDKYSLMPGQWFPSYANHLLKFGYQVEPHYALETCEPPYIPNQYYIGVYNTHKYQNCWEYDTHHAVVMYNGKIIHDPASYKPYWIRNRYTWKYNLILSKI